MSRSKRHSPVTGVALCASEKQDKQAWHRKFRRKAKERILQEDEYVDHREVSDIWTMGKDGKCWWGETPGAKWMRK